ncbi:MAG: OadG family protein [Prevotellaceae bacterium]|jgi:Na+-transporting methylmalonyl-CoA/oxaloacetate decarboxylase gamma subunit|nr:OadG family protein [Prevotellaceae bacterium]
MRLLSILLDASTISSGTDMLLNSGLAIVIVFSALTLLVCAFTFVGYLTKRAMQKRAVKNLGGMIAVNSNIDVAEVAADEIAAVAMALHLYMNADDIHDNESNIITIKQLKRSFSPWNSKNFRLLESSYRR